MLLVDEIEEVADHMCSNAVGESKFEDKIQINTAFDRQVKQSRIVVLCDAMMSSNTLERAVRLSKESGKKVYLVNTESKKQKPKVKVFKCEHDCVEDTMLHIAKGNKAAIFSDRQHQPKKSKLNALINAIEPAISGNHTLIDGAFMQNSETAKLMSDVDKLAADNQVLFYNSAAGSGVSIQDTDYKTLMAIGSGTLYPPG